MQYGRCAWCDEYGELASVVNRDKTTRYACEWICAACAEVERFEHADELLWNPVLLHSTRKQVFTSASLDIRLAS